MQLFFYHGYALYPTLWLVKTSMIAFYARLCWNTSKTYRIVTYVTYGILAASFIVLIFYKTFYCFPLVTPLLWIVLIYQSRVWDPLDQCTGGTTFQFTRTAYLTTTCVLDITTDIICLVLPMAILRNLRIDNRKKFALGVTHFF